MPPRVVAEVNTLRDGENPRLVVSIADASVKRGKRKNEDSVELSGGHAQAIVLRAVEGPSDKLVKVIPKYIVPSAYIALKHIPMTVTATTDCRKSRAIGCSLALNQLLSPFYLSARGECRRPETAAERALQRLWGTVLGIDPDGISAQDSFLRAGRDVLEP